MGIARIILDIDIGRLGEIMSDPRNEVRDWWRGWSERDVDSLIRKLDDPLCYNGGILKITIREHKAWPVLSRRLLSQNPKLIRSPVLAWAEGKGLFQMVRLLELKP